jgi:hypothetical protein
MAMLVGTFAVTFQFSRSRAVAGEPDIHSRAGDTRQGDVRAELRRRATAPMSTMASSRRH